MDVTLQRHCARYIYVVPDGLRELMSDISREVIRSNPEDSYTFIADYLDALIITRENARVAAKLVQTVTEISESAIMLLENLGIKRHDAHRIAELMQNVFTKRLRKQPGKKPSQRNEQQIIREIINKANLPREKLDEAAAVIQDAFYKFKERREQQKTLLEGAIDWRVAAKSTIRLYRDTDATSEEANRAATLIKASYKGFYTRKAMKKMAEEAALLYDHQDEEDEQDEQESEHLSPAKASLSTIEEVDELVEPTEEVQEIVEELLDKVVETAETKTERRSSDEDALEVRRYSEARRRLSFGNLSILRTPIAEDAHSRSKSIVSDATEDDDERPARRRQSSVRFSSTVFQVALAEATARDASQLQLDDDDDTVTTTMESYAMESEASSPDQIPAPYDQLIEDSNQVPSFDKMFDIEDTEDDYRVHSNDNMPTDDHQVYSMDKLPNAEAEAAESSHQVSSIDKIATPESGHRISSIDKMPSSTEGEAAADDNTQVPSFDKIPGPQDGNDEVADAESEIPNDDNAL